MASEEEPNFPGQQESHSDLAENWGSLFWLHHAFVILKLSL